jgi:hypothetical protein
LERPGDSARRGRGRVFNGDRQRSFAYSVAEFKWRNGGRYLTTTTFVVPSASPEKALTK